MPWLQGKTLATILSQLVPVLRRNRNRGGISAINSPSELPSFSDS